MKYVKTGYKVVYFFKSELFSIFSHAEVKYILNQKVYPKKGCGPLCVFDTLENAKKSYLPFFCGFKVFKCNYKESKKKKIWNNRYKSSLKDLPSGTRLANWVELIEEVVEL